MTNPFLVHGPAVISFSGGRTSGYMLRRILDAGLQPDVHVMFANTGKEREETLVFVHEVATRWQVPITWLEYRRRHLPVYKDAERAAAAAMARQLAGRADLYLPPGPEPGYVETTFAAAARNGEPFENLIDMHALPNVLTRMCSAGLKTRVIKNAMQARGYDHWDNVVGIRACEPLRVARMRAPTGQRYDNVLPLADAGVVKAEILDYWAASRRVHGFDLQLPLDENGDTYGGNCDMCFLKSTGKRARIAREEPHRVAWWSAQEARTGMVFRNQRHSYKHLLAQGDLLAMCDTDLEADDLGDCVCHD